MAPGDTRRLALTFDVSPKIDEAEVKVELSITDRDLREVASEKIKIAIESDAKLEAMAGPVKAKDGGASLFDSPSDGGRVFGKLPAGVALAATAKIGGFYKVTLPPLRTDKPETRFAFVAAKEMETGGTPSTEPIPYQDLLLRSPPLVDLTAQSLSTREGKVKIVGSASDNDRVLDGYVFVNARKVFYRSNRSGADPKKMTFDLDAPLRPGVNVIRFFARESADTVAAKTIVIRRDGANGELLPTPKGEESPFDSLGDDLSMT
jgi:carboxyl-terminal processing protease